MEGCKNSRVKISEQEKRELEERVLQFLKQQPGYESYPAQKLEAYGSKEEMIVVYGKDFFAGIAGIGDSVESTIESFKTSWKQLKGFNWITNH